MLLLIKNVDLYAPELRGTVDILLGGPDSGGRVLAVETTIDPASLFLPCEIIDGSGLIAVPGLVDNHVHITGGGGEGGWASRTNELDIDDAVLAGVTTVIGVLGTDGLSRSPESLVAKTLALREEGLSAWCYTGSYRVPIRTISGDATKDIMFVEPVIGVGEVAVSDHRSSKPTHAELARIASEARSGGMLSGKAGIVNIHLGDAPSGFEPLRRLVADGDLPATQLLPTHCGRNALVFAQALEWARSGGYIDFTTSTVPAFVKDGEITAAQALERARTEGIPLSRVSFSSDGQGSLPVFNESGALTGLTMGSCASLLCAVREAVALGIPLGDALLPVTQSPARMLKLQRKGRIDAGFDADVVLLEPESLAVVVVVGNGRVLVRGGQAMTRGAFSARRP